MTRAELRLGRPADVAARAGHVEPKFELRCTACGYGVIVRIAPVTCPMCHGSVWEHAAPVRRQR